MTLALTQTDSPWQLQMFQRSLKKQLKLDALLALMGDVSNLDCLLVTCGDNNGALNWYFRDQGGRWRWADVIGEGLAEMSALLNEPVYQVGEASLPFANQQFDCVVAIDVLEHLDEDQSFLQEIKRVLRPGGQAIVTVPNGDPELLANRIKWQVGMTPEVYGHTRAGYTVAELSQSVRQAGLNPVGQGGYSRFFTEMMELIINFGYVFVLSRKKKGEPSGQIAPTTSGELKTHGAAYKIYGVLYPIMRLVSQLDKLLPARTDNAVIVTAVKS
jgi:ubiquinone/menaquinone biosynthesis C-methylase UbiE